MPRFKTKEEFEHFMREKYAEMASALTLQPELMPFDESLTKDEKQSTKKAQYHIKAKDKSLPVKDEKGLL